MVEIDNEIDAQKTSEQELKRRHKFLGTLRIVTDRGLQVTLVTILDPVLFMFLFLYIFCFSNGNRGYYLIEWYKSKGAKKFLYHILKICKKLSCLFVE